MTKKKPNEIVLEKVDSIRAYDENAKKHPDDRHCYMMELDPKYVDVIIKRWEDHTGKVAELIEE